MQARSMVSCHAPYHRIFSLHTYARKQVGAMAFMVAGEERQVHVVKLLPDRSSALRCLRRIYKLAQTDTVVAKAASPFNITAVRIHFV